ncbi:MAG: family 10 glycosylhydrolase [Candidatus Delongbacteria bacterium]|nr:family 10 glycosylhydrolase [Candidatus Delongbacteria bacterium]MBN2833673.1 family 10 glycosylhydrolase [Candidatus Delongbacteria bacterium]
MEFWTWLILNRSKGFDFYKNLIDKLADNNFYGLHIDANKFDDFLEEVVDYAKGLGLKVHAWHWIMNANNDEIAQNEYPHLFNMNRKLQSSLTFPQYVDYYKWLCPENSETYEYLKNRISKLFNYNFDAIHLDYIRHPDVFLPVGLLPNYGITQETELPEYDYCYCNTCRNNFKLEYGVDPLNFSDPSEIREWKEFRLRSINRVVNKLSKFIKENGKKVSAAVFPYPEMAIDMVRQDWASWNIDMVFPMIYFQFYLKNHNWVNEVIDLCQSQQKLSQDLYAGLYLPEMKKEDFQSICKDLKDKSVNGVSLFPADGISDEFLSVAKNFKRK